MFPLFHKRLLVGSLVVLVFFSSFINTCELVKYNNNILTIIMMTMMEMITSTTIVVTITIIINVSFYKLRNIYKRNQKCYTDDTLPTMISGHPLPFDSSRPGNYHPNNFPWILIQITTVWIIPTLFNCQSSREGWRLRGYYDGWVSSGEIFCQ